MGHKVVNSETEEIFGNIYGAGGRMKMLLVGRAVDAQIQRRSTTSVVIVAETWRHGIRQARGP